MCNTHTKKKKKKKENQHEFCRCKLLWRVFNTIQYTSCLTKQNHIVIEHPSRIALSPSYLKQNLYEWVLICTCQPCLSKLSVGPQNSSSCCTPCARRKVMNNTLGSCVYADRTATLYGFSLHFTLY